MNTKEKNELEVTKKKEIESSTGEPMSEGVTYVPDVDILESEDAILLHADLPGVKPDDVDIDLREGILTLTAKVERPESQQRLIYREYEIGGYQRRFTVGERIDAGKINAQFDNGVLTLTLPKAEEAKPRKIKIQS